jgi:hypothetical protein
MGVCGQRHAPTALPPGKRRGTRCISGWVGPRAGLDGCGKCRLLPGFDPRTVQLVAGRLRYGSFSLHLCVSVHFRNMSVTF